MRRLAVVVLAALAVASCGGEEVSEEDVTIAQPTDSCRGAFEQAATEEDEDTSRLDTDEKLDTTSLGRLPATLTECDSFEDWLAGSRAFPDSLPSQMDRITALRLLCGAGDDDAPACTQLAPIGDQG